MTLFRDDFAALEDLLTERIELNRVERRPYALSRGESESQLRRGFSMRSDGTIFRPPRP